ncbi:MAG: hypothetical protein ACPGSM_02820 [Thiolinea sp.]
MKTLVFQSHAPATPPHWVQECLSSVQSWSSNHSYDYQLLGDELFQFIPTELREKFSKQKVILTDFGRVQWSQYFLKNYDEVLWLDSDFLIFNPQQFHLPRNNHAGLGYALGREVWVQSKAENSLKAYKKVHNAALYFRKGNAFADFYLSHAGKLLHTLEGKVPPQFIGPKLMTALHNVVGCPVMEQAGMFSPLVIKDIVRGGGAALQLMLAKSVCPPGGANLCSSMVTAEVLNHDLMQLAVGRLLAHGSVEF